RLELLLQRRELGERRIGIGLAVATVPAVAPSFDVFRTQLRIALRPIPARGTLVPLLARRPLAASRRIETLGARRPRRPIEARPTLLRLGALGSIPMPVSSAPAGVGCGRRLRRIVRRRRGLRWGADCTVGHARNRRRFRVAAWPPRVRAPLMAG